MSWLSNLSLLAAEVEAEPASAWEIARMVAIVFGVLVVPFILGNYLSKSLRMPDHGWKIGLIFSTLLAGVVIVTTMWPPKLAIDLKGGTRLIYEVDEEQRLRDGREEAVMKIKQEFAAGDDDQMTVGTNAQGQVLLEVSVAAESLIDRIEAETSLPEIQGGSLVLTLFEDSVEDGVHRYVYTLKVVKESLVQMDKLVAAVAERINPGGVKEIIIRPAGYGRLEIVIPVTKDDDPEEVELIKRKISTAGVLVFRILADRDRPEHAAAIRSAEMPENQGNKDVRVGLRTIARWVEVDPQVGNTEKEGTVDVSGAVTRQDGTEVLVMIDRQNVTGGYLSSVSGGFGEGGRIVDFGFNAAGAVRFGKLTSNNLPDETTGRHSRLGIVLDGRLLSAPNIITTISDQGQITGDFSPSQINFLVGVLDAGSLPTALHSRPISELKTSATQGADLINRGMAAMAISLMTVFVFMLVYYRFAGIVAAFALAMNLVLILALMITVKAAFSLAGIAGLVLTVGMAVDANVLIFERIREELNRGSALRLAIRNGFSRATRTIVDANLTTLIVALVLFVIGRDQLKSFAVTLILGITLSMYTAIFCSRVIFDIAERKRWITRLGMMRLLGETKIDFLGKRRLAAVASCALIVLGLVGVVGRGSGLLDIDFTGGVSVQVRFASPQDTSYVRNLVTEADKAGKLPDSTVAAIGDADEAGKFVEFKIDTSIHEDGVSAEVPFKSAMDISDVRVKMAAVIEAGQLPDATVTAIGGPDEAGKFVKFKIDTSLHEAKDDDSPQDQVRNVLIETFGDQLDSDSIVMDDDSPQDQVPEYSPQDQVRAVLIETFGNPLERYSMTSFTGGVSVQLRFKRAMDISDVQERIEAAEDELPDATVAAVGDSDDAGKYVEFKIDTSIREEKEGRSAQDQVRAVLIDDIFGDRLERYSMFFGGVSVQLRFKSAMDISEVRKKIAAAEDAGKLPDATVAAVGESDDAGKFVEFKIDTSLQEEKDGRSPQDQVGNVLDDTFGDQLERRSITVEAVEEVFETAAEPKDAPAVKSQNDLPANPDPKGEQKTKLLSSKVKLHFPKKISHDTLEEEVNAAMKKLAAEENTARVVTFNLSNTEYDEAAGGSHAYVEWEVEFAGLDKTEASAVLNIIKTNLASKPVFPSVNVIGGQVAGDTQNKAIVALFVSLLAIVGYIWFRFKQAMFGLAAVVALVHDVLITLGMIALSYWVAPFLGILLIDPFKISLPVLAAFLTIIGYSLNDTIVVFDRIREVKGKSPHLTEEIVNTSINQTLARTLLTSLTTLLVVGILYWGGGQGIHGFAFALLIGVLVGTYSSIFVASPVLLWMSKSAQKPGGRKVAKTAAASA